MDADERNSLQRLRGEADAALGENLHDLFTGHEIPATATQTLLVNSSRSGLKFEHAFRAAARCATVTHANPRRVKQTAWKSFKQANASRSLFRWMNRKSQWPKFYWAKIPLWDPKKKAKATMGALPAST